MNQQAFYKKLLFVFVFIINLSENGFAQTDEVKPKLNFFIEPNLMLGKIVKNYSGFPESNHRQTLFMDLGFYDNRAFNSASRFYNNPSSGISLAYSTLGNDSVFGREVDLVPFIDLNASKQLKTLFILNSE